MGVIKRQGIKSIIVNFVGAFVGAFAALFIYTSNDEIYGYAQFLYSTAVLLLPIATLGVLSLVVKYFPTFEKSDSKNYNGFLTLIALSLLTVFGLFSIAYYFLKDHLYWLLDALRMDATLFEGSEIIILGIIFTLALSYFLTFQSANKLRIVVPNIITQLGYKLFLPILVLAYAYWQFSSTVFAYAIVGFFLTTVILLGVYLYFINGISLGKIKRPSPDFRFREMFSYAMYGSLNQLSQNLAFRLDTVMIALFINTEHVSFYFKAFVFTSLIEMPTRAINQIASPIISKAWKEKNMDELKNVYQKTSVNLFVTGCFLFLGLWYCLEDLVNISSDPSKFPHLDKIFFLLGMSKLIDMVTSVNNSILIYSKYYRYNLLFLIMLGIGNLFMNIVLIPKYGIVGAAIATSISVFLYNLIKLIFIYVRFGLQPFTMGTIKTTILFLFLFGLFFIIPFNFSPIINIILKSIFVSALYLPLAYLWKVSLDINTFVLEIKNAITSRLWN